MPSGARIDRQARVQDSRLSRHRFRPCSIPHIITRRAAACSRRHDRFKGGSPRPKPRVLFVRGFFVTNTCAQLSKSLSCAGRRRSPHPNLSCKSSVKGDALFPNTRRHLEMTVDRRLQIRTMPAASAPGDRRLASMILALSRQYTPRTRRRYLPSLNAMVSSGFAHGPQSPLRSP